MHTLIIGKTRSGKSFLAKQMCRQALSLGIKTIVYDPLEDLEWKCSFRTSSEERFMQVVRASRGCLCFVDEAGQAVTNYASPDMLWTAQRSRHLGHKFVYISQRVLKSLDRSVRDQCSTLYLFRVALPDAKELAETWADSTLLHAARLQKYRFLYKNDNGEKFMPAKEYVLKAR